MTERTDGFNLVRLDKFNVQTFRDFHKQETLDYNSS